MSIFPWYIGFADITFCPCNWTVAEPVPFETLICRKLFPWCCFWNTTTEVAFPYNTVFPMLSSILVRVNFSASFTFNLKAINVFQCNLIRILRRLPFFLACRARFLIVQSIMTAYALQPIAFWTLKKWSIHDVCPIHFADKPICVLHWHH